MDEVGAGFEAPDAGPGGGLAASIRRATMLATSERDLAARERDRASEDIARADNAPERSRGMHLRAAAMHQRAASLHDAAAQLQDLHRTHLIELSAPRGSADPA
ncbi:MAG: hypothetical protein ACRDYU_02775 [Actinomycetes bacterium]